MNIHYKTMDMQMFRDLVNRLYPVDCMRCPRGAVYYSIPKKQFVVMLDEVLDSDKELIINTFQLGNYHFQFDYK